MMAFITALRFAGWTAALLPVQIFLVRFNMPLSKRLPMIWHRGVCRILAFRVEQHGEISRTRPTMFVCNHTSYLDISILGAVLPASFVAKAEVRGWPLFGLLARLQRTVFVERRASRTAEHRDEMVRRLEKGDNLILFPEGTSNDGNRVLPFKSAFFGAAEKTINGEPLTVQPVSISYIRLDGIPVGRGYRPYFAWYGDMEMAGHLWNVFGLGQTTVAVEFHQPVSIADFASRKEMSAHCHRVVSDGVSRGIHGRLGKAAKHAWWAPKSA
ncbi:MAG: lysophospholipid acyltransferase family protein [Alphaproteobacteria bacterium]|jgi:1-acyl-sn-glycerol-3-phosphate acyltransferase|nr:lysophospholipid acyltransferase family protein [Alphaproteobacteria bacterium]|tara:strand:- start:1929 stop:2738 length:810 start_codon:yes stop_codon:yes gene_type:complete